MKKNALSRLLQLLSCTTMIVITGCSTGRPRQNSFHTAAPISTTFADSTIAHLDVGPAWWSWLWFGLVAQPCHGTVHVYQNVQKQVHPWWCLWLCTETQTVQQPVNAAAITVAALAYSASDVGQQVIDQGKDSCTSCSSLTHSVVNIGFPVPPWLDGGYKGIGFRAIVSYKEQTMTLHDHWGDGTKFPPDFQ